MKKSATLREPTGFEGAATQTTEKIEDEKEKKDKKGKTKCATQREPIGFEGDAIQAVPIGGETHGNIANNENSYEATSSGTCGRTRRRPEYVSRLQKEWVNGPCPYIPLTLEVPLHAEEMNVLLTGLTEVSAYDFYDYLAVAEVDREEKQRMKELIKKILAVNKPVRFPILVKEHWVAAELNGSELIVFDSSPSAPVRNAITKMMEDLELPSPTFRVVPTQLSRSNECGLFTAMYVLARCEGIDIPQTTRPVSLKHLLRARSLDDFRREARETLKKVREPLGGATPMAYEKVQEILRTAKIGDRVEFTFHHSQQPDEVIQWYGSIDRMLGTARAPKCSVRWDRTVTDDDELEEIAEKATLPAVTKNDTSIVTLALRLNPVGEDTGTTTSTVAPPRLAESGTAIRDYPEPTEVNGVDPQQWQQQIGPGQRTRITTGQDFIEWELLHFNIAERRARKLISWSAVTAGVRSGHHKELCGLKNFIVQHGLEQTNLDISVVQYIQTRRESSRKKLAYSTVSRILGTMIGAFQALPFYTKYGPSVNITDWPFVKGMAKAVERMTARDGVHEPTPATPVEVGRALRNLDRDGHLDAAALLVGSWYTCQRPSDVLLVETAHVTKPEAEDQYQIGFNQGKTVGRIPPYYINCRIPNEEARNQWDHKVSRALNRRQKYLFEFKNRYQRSKLLTTLLAYLRQVNPKLEQRSLRRGSLQKLAETVEEQDVLDYSKHKHVQMLRHYLSNGRLITQEHRRIMAAADTLAPPAGGGPTETNKGDNNEDMSFGGLLLIDREGHVKFSTDHPPPALQDDLDITDWPLHIKWVTEEPCDIDEITKLAEACPADLRNEWAEASRWLRDISLYEYDFNVKRARPSQVQQRYVDDWMRVKHAVRIADEDICKITGSIVIKLTPERTKCRVRGLQVHFDLNERHPKGSIYTPPNSTRRSARAAVLKAKGCSPWDMAGYYPQFPVTEEISYAQAFLVNGQWYRFTRMVTGARWSAAVATAATRVLSYRHDTRGDVIVDTCVDNVRFAGDEGPVNEAAWEFVKRCAQCKVKLNEVNVYEATWQDVCRNYRTQDDFFGEMGDYNKNELQCREKHVQRLSEYWEAVQRRGAVHATWFGLYALMRYMSETLGIPLSERMQVVRWFSRRARELAQDVTRWEKPISIRPPLVAMKKWMAELLQNRKARMVWAPQVDAVVFIDACNQGYAALVTTESDVELIQQRWHTVDRQRDNMYRSTNSEPEAIARVSEALQRMGVKAPMFVTDHEQFMWAIRKRCSMAEGNNERLNRVSPWARAVYEPGELNLADKYSRFKKHKLDEKDVEEATRRAQLYRTCPVTCGPAYGIVGFGRELPSRLFT